jgi:hypothetical protein
MVNIDCTLASVKTKALNQTNIIYIIRYFTSSSIDKLTESDNTSNTELATLLI